MKIHESMNVSLHVRKIFLLLPAFLFWIGRGEVVGQTTPVVDVMNIVMLKNTTWQHDFNQFNVTLAPEIDRSAREGRAYFSPSSCCNEYGPGLGKKGVKGWNKPNRFFYEPNSNFIGHDTVVIEYYLPFGTYLNQTAYKIIQFTVVPSYLTAHNDFASTTQGQSVDINVLTNDIGNGTNLSVAEVTTVNYGSTQLLNGKTTVRFTPATGFAGLASFSYTICDAQGSCSMATVNIRVNPQTSPAYDSLFIATGKNTPIVILPEINNQYKISLAPAKGTLDTIETLVYVPNLNNLGDDKIVFTNPVNNHKRVVQIRILDVPSSNKFLFNDIVNTPVNEPIEEIYLLRNDVAPDQLNNVGVTGYPNTKAGGQLTYLPGVGKGVYRYVPKAGFEGVDKFTYKATPKGSSAFEYATCYIIVNNLKPALPVYQVSTARNTPLVLGDHLPFTAYEYANINYDGNGNVKFYPGYNTIISQHGQVFSGYNMLVYEPAKDFNGKEDFEFTYCPGGQSTGCPLVKVEVDVTNISQEETICAGSNCVWPGDANRDGTVDVRDVLPIGMCMGEVGENRENSNLSWHGQYADNWNSLFATGLGYDVKYLDADGNGIVSSQDTVAISQFYGRYHNLTPQPAQAVENMPFYLEDLDLPEELQIGDVFFAPIHLGTNTSPAINAYGLAFELSYDPAIFDANIHFSKTSWMNYNSPVLSFVKKLVTGKIDAAYTRTSGKAAQGFGRIGMVEFIVIDDVSGNRPNSNTTTISLNSLGLMNGNGQVSGVNGNSLTLKLGSKDQDKENSLSDQLRVFPNPADAFVTFHLNGGPDNKMERVVLYNIVGSVVYDSGKMTAKRMQVNVSQMAPGMYTARVYANNGEVISSKIEVIRN
jgi:hypothetical protein